MNKIGKIIYYAVIVVAVLVYVIVLVGDDMAGSSIGITIGLILSAAAVLGTVLSSVMYLINNPKSAKSLLVAAGVLILVCVLGYTMSPGELGLDYDKYEITTSHQSKMVDMGIYLTLFLGVVSVVSILVSETIALFKN